MAGQIPKYPHIQVRLVGEDDNAFVILGRVQQALVQGGVDKAEIDAYLRDATSRDYNHLLQTTVRWVAVI